MSFTNTPTFLPGLELSRRFYTETVRPLLEEAAPDLPHSAARIGGGSEVLGYDTPGSRDPEWGPRLQLFLRTSDLPRHAGRIRHHLAEHLPKTFHGHPTHQCVEVTHTTAWFTAALGFDPTHGTTVTNWLDTPTHLLTEVTAGAVFHDGLHRLGPLRHDLRWYPHEVWLHVLAREWQHIAEREAFVRRCGEVGDELGSAVAAAHVTRHLMRLCLLMDRRYPPYDKWLGTAFARTAAGHRLTPVLKSALTATDWQPRENHLTHAYEAVATIHNQLNLTDGITPTPHPLHAERFTTALLNRITDPTLRRLPER
ncbi:DUF4037 domain-containing protein [Streptomyces sp. NPDC091280]|uniref:DUF4037 domain-containing protein n=1 Tax=Streptomyces sp. NPDC091280 TaxID=3365984 RepID=UPI0038278F1D